MNRFRDVNEESVAYITADFFSKTGQAVTPTSAQYRLDDITDGIKCAREILDWTDVVVSGSSHEFTVTDQQNAMLNPYRAVELKQLTVEAMGSDGLPFRNAYTYQVVNLAGTE